MQSLYPEPRVSRLGRMLIALGATLLLIAGPLYLAIAYPNYRFQFGRRRGLLSDPLALLIGRQAATIVVILLAGALLAWILYHTLTYYFTPKFEAGQCRKCGYDLRGNKSGVCPECGHPWKRTVVTRWPH